MPDFSSADVGKAYQLFFNALGRGGIEPICETFYELLGFPVIVSNDAGVRLCQLPLSKRDNEDWNYFLKNGTLSNSHYMKMLENYISKPDLYNQPLEINDGYLDRERQLYAVVAHQGRPLGSFAAIIGDAQLGEYETAIARIFISALRMDLIRQSQITEGYDQRKMNRLAAILMAKDHSSSEYLMNIVSLQRFYFEKFEFVLVKVDIGFDSSVSERICLDIMRSYPECLSVIADGTVVTLCSGIRAGRHKWPDIVELVKAYPASCGVSSVFSNIAQIPSYYYQAKLTLESGLALAPDESVYQADRYLPFQPFFAAKAQGPLDVFIDPLLYRIDEYDKKNGTSYFGTLETFLFCMRDRTATAKRLFIHPNTMTYRLNRIQDFFSIDFEDFELMRRLNTSFTLWHIIGPSSYPGARED